MPRTSDLTKDGALTRLSYLYVLPDTTTKIANFLAFSDGQLAAPTFTRNKHFWITREGYFVLFQDVAASSANIAKFGESCKIFEIAFEEINDDVAATQQVTWKSVCGRYQSLKYSFDCHDNKNQEKLWVIGNVQKLEELLISIRDGRDDLLEEQKAEKNEPIECDSEKEKSKNEIMNAAMHRSGNKDIIEDEDEDSIPARPVKEI